LAESCGNELEGNNLTNINNNQNEKERKDFLDKLKNIRQILIQDLTSRKKLITLLSEKIEIEKDCFFTFEDDKAKIPK